MGKIQSLREIKNTQKNIAFFVNVLVKSLKIIFRTDKNIKMIHASFSNRQVQDRTLIKFRFRNALWYEFENVNTDRREFTIPKPGFLEKRTLIVHGLFRTKKYILTFDEALQYEKRIRFCQSAEKFENYAVQEAYPAEAVLARN